MSNELDTLMSMDHVIRVHPDGTITEPRDVYAPEVYVDVDAHGQCLPDSDRDLITRLRTEGWELATGFTGQHGYNGPLMHPSEFIGGGIERFIRENPGLYVACSAECLGPREDADPGEPAGWVLAYRHDDV